MDRNKQKQNLPDLKEMELSFCLIDKVFDAFQKRKKRSVKEYDLDKWSKEREYKGYFGVGLGESLGIGLGEG